MENVPSHHTGKKNDDFRHDQQCRRNFGNQPQQKIDPNRDDTGRGNRQDSVPTSDSRMPQASSPYFFFQSA